MITQKELKRLLYYCKQTGHFIHKRTRPGVRAGSIAGTVDRYINIGVKGHIYKAHRLAWFYVHGVWPIEVDHINHIKTDNRFINFREVSHIENGKNQTKRKDNISGLTGISFDDRRKKWRSYISVNKKQEYLGFYIDKFEAICARKSAEAKYDYHYNHGASCA